jgi:Rrf2 family protein
MISKQFDRNWRNATMKLSTRGRYGLKAMVDLAVEYGKGTVSIASLAAQQSISEAYLEQLIAALKKAGLVNATRGALGGYTLSRSPELIDVGEILRALEGTTDLINCVGVDKVNCDNACSCSARPLWLKLQSKINDVLSTTTLKDMAEDYKVQMRRCENNESLS